MLLTVFVPTGVPAALAVDEVSAPLIDFGVKGGWCWFQDERAIVDQGRLIFGSVASPSGDVNVTVYDLAAKTARTVCLHPKFQSDDHDAPAFLKLADGRYLAAYMSHGAGPGVDGADRMRWRISTRPGDATEWQPEQTVSVGAGVSYANLYRLSAEGGRIYNFHRGLGFNPNWLYSDDDGRTFTYGGRLLHWDRIPREPGSGRPYPRYCGNGVDTVHLMTTEDHPSNYDNSIYHAYLKGGQLHHSDGKPIGALSRARDTTIKPDHLTRVYQGDADHVAWTNDIRLDDQQRPYIAFSVQVGDGDKRQQRSSGGQDLRYFYGRWDGARWAVHEIAFAGTRLYASQPDYAGLVALHPADPNVLWISTNSDPRSGAPLLSTADGQRHREIFRGVTADGGRTWTWTAVTSNSRADNIRPIARVVAGRQVIVLWQRGIYTSYTAYDMRIVGILDQ
jgi:hypothetical protein